MKRVEAIIRPHRLSEALAALVKLRITGVTVVDSLGFGLNPGHSDVFEQTIVHRDDDMEIGLVPKKLLVMYMEDEHVRVVVDTIAQIARTGYPGDGKIAISHLEELVRVRVEPA
jgi:nitrogen regulatory protein PII